MKRAYTDGHLFIETWVGKGNNSLSQVTVGQIDVSHIIQVHNGSTLTREY